MVQHLSVLLLVPELLVIREQRSCRG